MKDHRAQGNQAVVMELSETENEQTSNIAFPPARLAHSLNSFHLPIIFTSGQV